MFAHSAWRARTGSDCQNSKVSLCMCLDVPYSLCCGSRGLWLPLTMFMFAQANTVLSSTLELQ